MKRMFWILVIINLMILPLMGIDTFSQKEGTQIEVKVKAGFGGGVRVGYTNPFYFELTSKDENIEGELTVNVRESDISQMLYSIKVDLPKDVKKAYVVNAPVNFLDKEIPYTILRDNKEVVTGKISVDKFISPYKSCIGVISDTQDAFSGVSYVGTQMGTIISSGPKQPQYYSQKGMRIQGSGVTYSSQAIQKTQETETNEDMKFEVIGLTAADVPEQRESLEFFDVIIINNFDTSTMNAKQVEAIDGWVKSGKELIVGLGDSSSKVLSGLQSTLPLKIESEATMDISGPMLWYTAEQAKIPPLIASKVSLKAGKAVISDGGIDLISYTNIGNGIVVTSAFNLTTIPPSWKGYNIFWKNIFNLVNDNITKADNLNQYNGMNEVMYSLPEDKSPPFKYILITLAIYILLVAPILYIVLKLIDKRDLAWIIIPTISILFLVILYFIGYNTRYNEGILNTLSIVELDSKTNTKKLKSNLVVFNDKKGNLKVDIARKDNITTTENYIHNEMLGRGVVPIPQIRESKIELGTTGKIYSNSERKIYDYYNTGLWANRVFYKFNTIPYDKKIETEFKLENDMLTVEVTNNTQYNLTDSYVFYSNSVVEIGDLPAGSTRKGSRKIVGNNPVGINNPGVFYQYFNEKYNYMLEKDEKKQREGFRKQRIFEGSSFMVNTKLNNNLFKSAFMAISNDSGEYYDIKINDKSPKRYDTNLLISYMDVSYQKGSKFSFEPGMLRPIIKNSNNINGNQVVYVDPNQPVFNAYNQGEYLLEYNILENMKISYFKFSNTKFYDSFKSGNMHILNSGIDLPAIDSFKFEIYNVKLSKWEPISDGKEFNSEINDYIDKDKIKIKLTILTDPKVQYNQTYGLPEIELKGEV